MWTSLVTQHISSQNKISDQTQHLWCGRSNSCGDPMLEVLHTVHLSSTPIQYNLDITLQGETERHQIRGTSSTWSSVYSCIRFCTFSCCTHYIGWAAEGASIICQTNGYQSCTQWPTICQTHMFMWNCVVNQRHFTCKRRWVIIFNFTLIFSKTMEDRPHTVCVIWYMDLKPFQMW